MTPLILGRKHNSTYYFGVKQHQLYMWKPISKAIYRGIFTLSIIVWGPTLYGKPLKVTIYLFENEQMSPDKLKEWLGNNFPFGIADFQGLCETSREYTPENERMNRWKRDYIFQKENHFFRHVSFRAEFVAHIFCWDEFPVEGHIVL